MSEINKADIVILIGDMNAQVGYHNKGFEATTGRHGLGMLTENGEMFTELCTNFNLVIGETLFNHKRVHKITWTSPDRMTETLIDHIAISRKWRGSLMDTRNKRGADIASDHHLLITPARLKVAAVSDSKKKIQKIFDVKKLKDESICAREIKNQLNFTKTRSAIGTTAHLQQNRQADKKKALERIIWSDNLARKAQEAAETYRTRDLYQMKRELTNATLKTTKPLKDEDGKLTTAKDKQTTIWERYYKKLLSSTSSEAIQRCGSQRHIPRRDNHTSCPNDAEIITAIRALRNNKTSGSDNINSELLKANPVSSTQIYLGVRKDKGRTERRCYYSSSKEGKFIGM
ncbi:uncharacterized protein LOC120780396 [Bactrocera tryoni]|uniref:uncharacterized protein LOC120780396 n=1 Tax=Bactrocera tryoni TaxID=59916 RepID=UPI001A96F902|nr:uncharacterized protein LOC120780396 [Bactrocera tryoni]